jgi:hypothetical protein
MSSPFPDSQENSVPRTLVLFFDGTAYDYEATVSILHASSAFGLP